MLTKALKAKKQTLIVNAVLMSIPILTRVSFFLAVTRLKEYTHRR